MVEIIGDELMSIFQGSDAAIDAACKIQKSLASDSKFQLGVRIGFHFGQTAEMDGHPYGGTVNVAARMAKSGQIITNVQTREHLATLNQACMRYVDRVFVKGKKVRYDLHEVVWDENESTA